MVALLLADNSGVSEVANKNVGVASEAKSSESKPATVEVFFLCNPNVYTKSCDVNSLKIARREYVKVKVYKTALPLRGSNLWSKPLIEAFQANKVSLVGGKAKFEATEGNVTYIVRIKSFDNHEIDAVNGRLEERRAALDIQIQNAKDEMTKDAVKIAEFQNTMAGIGKPENGNERERLADAKSSLAMYEVSLKNGEKAIAKLTTELAALNEGNRDYGSEVADLTAKLNKATAARDAYLNAQLGDEDEDIRRAANDPKTKAEYVKIFEKEIAELEPKLAEVKKLYDAELKIPVD